MILQPIGCALGFAFFASVFAAIALTVSVARIVSNAITVSDAATASDAAIASGAEAVPAAAKFLKEGMAG